MPTVATDGPYRFVVNTRENEFEPPHVHVFVGHEDVCRQREIGLAYSKHCASIQRAWDEIHGDR